MTLPRFAHTTPDSAYYIALTGYFKEQAGRDELVTPFAFRWVVPWLASWLPVESSAVALALCSTAAFACTTLCVDRLLRKLHAPPAGVNRGVLAFLFSFPAVNYGGAVLTDSAGMFVLLSAACALVERRFLLLGILAVAGAGVRETTLILLPATVIFLILKRDLRGLVAAVFLVPFTLAAVLMPRWYFSDLPAYRWHVDWHRFTENLTRPVSWATVLLTVIPIAILAWPGFRQFSKHPSGVRHLVIAAGVPGLALLGFSVAAAFMSGRFAWPLYLALVPLIAFSRPAPTPGSD